jgi:hypothetical protein
VEEVIVVLQFVTRNTKWCRVVVGATIWGWSYIEEERHGTQLRAPTKLIFIWSVAFTCDVNVNKYSGRSVFELQHAGHPPHVLPIIRPGVMTGYSCLIWFTWICFDSKHWLKKYNFQLDSKASSNTRLITKHSNSLQLLGKRKTFYSVRRALGRLSVIG